MNYFGIPPYGKQLGSPELGGGPSKQRAGGHKAIRTPALCEYEPELLFAAKVMDGIVADTKGIPNQSDASKAVNVDFGCISIVLKFHKFQFHSVASERKLHGRHISKGYLSPQQKSATICQLWPFYSPGMSSSAATRAALRGGCCTHPPRPVLKDAGGNRISQLNKSGCRRGNASQPFHWVPAHGVNHDREQFHGVGKAFRG